MDYSRFINRTSAARKPQVLRQMCRSIISILEDEQAMKLGVDISKLVYMSGGLPNDIIFPFTEATFKLLDETEIKLTGPTMTAALQYSPTSGYPPLLADIKEILKTFHNPPLMGKPGEEGGLDVCIIPGSQEGITKGFEMMFERGDSIIVENPTYTGALEVLKPMGVNMVPVKTDQDGLMPQDLKLALSRWKPSDAKDPKSGIPKAIYIVPTGGNPSGATLPTARRQQIYQIAREYDLLIIEDDPYYFIHFSEEKPPSFLSLDVDGRVIRLDSFSKIISSGMRVGYVSGPEPLLTRIKLHHQISSQHAPSISQVLIHELLKKWGMDGFKQHTEKVKEFYRVQRDAVQTYAKKYLDGLAEWTEPSGGMFLWIKVKGLKDARDLVHVKLLQKKVFFAPGYCFTTDYDEPCPYIRASYSFVTDDKMDIAFRVLAETIKEELANGAQ